MSLHALVYYSQAVPGLTIDKIDDLAQDAAAHNHMAGVTGALFTDGRQFLQYIEGPEDGIASAYGRIINAKSHTELVVLGRGRGGQRRFPYWSMNWIPVDAADIRIAAVSDWRGLARCREESPVKMPTGVDRLRTLAQPYVN